MAERGIGTVAPEIVITDDATELAREASRRVVAALEEAIRQRGEGHVALTGGSSAITLYKELAANWGDAIDWRRVHLWWGDERFVPIDHPESNSGLAYASLLQISARGGMSGFGGGGADVDAGDLPGLPIPTENIHPVGIDGAQSDSAAAGLVAERYAQALEALLPRTGGMPVFDVILLGVGDDGHILSVFPGSSALEPDAPLVTAVPAPDHIGPRLPRVTLNPRLLEAARLVIVMVPGGGKAEVIGRIFAGSSDDPRDLPALLARRANAVWLLDRESAAQLPVRG